LSTVLSLDVDSIDQHEVVKHLRMLIVDPPAVRQEVPLERLTLEVESQGLMYSTLEGFVVEERFRLSL
jgi:hypothetical protein